MGARNEKVKITFEDKWYKLYTKKAGHRQHKNDKYFNNKKIRRINKKECEKGVDRLTPLCYNNSIERS